MSVKKQKRGFSPDFHIINDILMALNPMGVEGPVLMQEYTRYIPKIIQLKNNRKGLVEYLEYILVDEMGVADPEYDEGYKQIANDLADEIQKIK